MHSPLKLRTQAAMDSGLDNRIALILEWRVR
jgi:hypothetical protein